MKFHNFVGIVLCLSASAALAKLPPAPPVDPKVTAEKAEKDKATAEKTKAQQAAAEDRAVQSFQVNMKAQKRPIPKPTPILPPSPSATAPALKK